MNVLRPYSLILSMVGAFGCGSGGLDMSGPSAEGLEWNEIDADFKVVTTSDGTRVARVVFRQAGDREKIVRLGAADSVTVHTESKSMVLDAQAGPDGMHLLYAGYFSSADGNQFTFVVNHRGEQKTAAVEAPTSLSILSPAKGAKVSIYERLNVQFKSDSNDAIALSIDGPCVSTNKYAVEVVSVFDGTRLRRVAFKNDQFDLFDLPCDVKLRLEQKRTGHVDEGFASDGFWTSSIEATTTSDDIPLRLF